MDCDSIMRGFKSRQPPHFFEEPKVDQAQRWSTFFILETWGG
jgi:hypothetical protein